MVRPRRVAGIASLALCGALLAALPVPASAAGPPGRLTLIPPFGAYGGINVSGSQTTAHRVPYGGGSKIVAAPAFNLTTGQAVISQWTYSQQGRYVGGLNRGGVVGFQSWAGVENLSFACGAQCASGTHEVRFAWNLSWATSLSSNCSAYYSAGTWARASVEVYGAVYNSTGGGHVLVGSDEARVVHEVIAGRTGWSAANGSRLKTLDLGVSLNSGSTYAIVAFVYLQTWAHSLVGCISFSEATLSSPMTVLGVTSTPPAGFSGLRSIRVA